MTRKFISPTTIFIACEGKNTEPLYFERIKEEIEEEEQFALTIYPERSNNEHKSHPIGLIEEAQSRINDFDEVWVVYDKDGYTKHQEAVELAAKVINGKIVHIAFSSIAFEQWVLLHFEKNNHAFSKSENVIDYLTSNNYFPDYTKSGAADTYPFLKQYLPVALENAAWLRFQVRQQLVAHPLFSINPYTDVDRLLRKLFDIQKEHVFIDFNEQTTIGTLIFCCQRDEEILQIAVFNESDPAILSKEVTICTHPQMNNYSFKNSVILPNADPLTVEINIQDLQEIRINYAHKILVLLLP
ncbi:MAG: RloB family protein [Aureispira sp.]